MQSNDRPPSESQASDTPSTVRMVIRARIEPEPIPEVPLEEWNVKAIVLAAAALVVVLVAGWFGVRALMRDDDTAPTDASVTLRGEDPVVPPLPSAGEGRSEQSDELTAANQAPTSEPPELRNQGSGQLTSPDASYPAPPIDASVASPDDDAIEAVTQVQPEVSQKALDTIRGTVRVAIEVTIDRNGDVLATQATIPGPSRYFERASHAAAEKWKFTPSSSDTPRTMLLRFHYTRGGVETLIEP